MQDNKVDSGDNVIFISFADNKVPEFKVVQNKDWILFGSDNNFPAHLLYLFNKSSNHNAIINGKVSYIMGKGISNPGTVNTKGESANTVFKKCCIDIEIFGGFYLQAIQLAGGKWSFTHMPFQNIRRGKDKNGEKGFYYKKEWSNKKYVKDADAVWMNEFDPKKPKGAMIFSYQEYRPGCDTYPLPSYFGALNDIETDVEISKYYLSVMKNGQFSGKLVSFFDGVPTDEQKRKLEKKWNEKFSGSENAGRTMLAFNNASGKAPEVEDLSSTDLDKLFEQLSKSIQGKIFSGHQVTSPMLFGIQEPGKLGGRSEMQDAYEIFKNTYVNDKQQALEEVISYLAQFMGIPAEQKIIPVEPLSISLNPTDFKEMLPKEWVYERFGIDPDDYPEIASTPSGVTGQGLVNDSLKNLTGRQSQNIQRIVRHYKTGKLTKPMAQTLLRGGLGLDDSQIATFLDFAAVEEEEDVADMFETIGTSREQFTIVKSKPRKEDLHLFAEVKGNDSSILDLIRKDKRITAEVIAKTIKEDVDYVRARIGVLEEKGILQRSVSTIGVDTIIEHAINQDVIDSRTPPETVDVMVRYSYEVKPGIGPELIETSRPFCRKLIGLDRLYSRAEIETISQKVGYSVFDRKGGFWGHKDECRHRWVSNVVIKKKV